MPRPRAFPAWIAAAIVCAAVPPSALHAAVAAAAGTLFEATPFVLAGGAAQLRWMRWFVPFVGCGCARKPGSGALSLPAATLTWLAFGPVVALGRFAAGAACVTLCDPRLRRTVGRALLAGFARQSPARGSPDACAPALRTTAAPNADRATGATTEFSEPLAELEAIAVRGFAFGLAVTLWQWIWAEPDGAMAVRWLLVHVPFWKAGAAFAGPLLCLAAGALAGRLAPCTTAAGAVAVVLRAASPAAAYGVLLTAGLWTNAIHRGTHRRAAADARPSFALVALACFAVAVRGGHGFVHPRLVPLIAVAAIACAVVVLRSRPTTFVRFPLAAPGLMLVALVMGSPLPPSIADASEATLEDLYVGQRVAFVGRLAADHVRLVRYVISCCRADAAPIAIRLTHVSGEPQGAWLAADGPVISDARGLALDARRLRRIPAPADPFAYR